MGKPYHVWVVGTFSSKTRTQDWLQESGSAQPHLIWQCFPTVPMHPLFTHPIHPFPTTQMGCKFNTMYLYVRTLHIIKNISILLARTVRKNQSIYSVAVCRALTRKCHCALISSPKKTVQPPKFFKNQTLSIQIISETVHPITLGNAQSVQ